MRQRLGIAHALLGDPQVLILDEPANGLDPAGIRWMRGLLRGFADRGGTVLLSSHLLHEVEVIADELVVIGRGRIVAQGTKDVAAGLHRHVRPRPRRRPRWPPRCTAAGIELHHADKGGFVTDAHRRAGRPAAAHAAVVLLELRTADGAGLEDMFLSLTADDARETSRPRRSPHEHHRQAAHRSRRHRRSDQSTTPRRCRSVPARSGSSCASWSTPAPGSGC